MNNTLKLVSLLVAFLMLISMTACSQGTPESTPDTSYEDSTSGTSSEDSAPSDVDSQPDDSATSAESSDSGDILKPIGGDASTTAPSKAKTTGKTGSKTGGKTTAKTTAGNVLGTEENDQTKKFGNLKGTTLRVVVGAGMDDNQKAFFQQFKEKYQLKKLDTVVYAYSEEQQKLPLLITSGDAKNYLDVCTTGVTTLLKYIYGNVLQPIDKYVDVKDVGWAYPGTENDKNPKSMLDAFKVDGHYYGCSSYGYQETYIFYNKTYFNEKRVPDPYTEYYKKNNWNFETFKEVCRAATDFDKDGKTVKTYAFATWNYAAFLQAAGNSGIESAGRGKWKSTIDTNSGLAALDLLYECSANNWFTWNISGYNEFLERKTAMLIERPANAMAGNDCYNRMTDEIGMVPMPKWRNSDPYYAPTTFEGKGVPVCSKNVPGAVAFIYEYTNYERKRNMATEGYGREQRLKTISDEHFAIRNEYLKNATLNVTLLDSLSGWYNENRNQFFGILFEEKVKPANALDRMKPLVEDALKKTVG